MSTVPRKTSAAAAAAMAAVPLFSMVGGVMRAWHGMAWPFRPVFVHPHVHMDAQQGYVVLNNIRANNQS